jgi:hypothetical protein
MRLEQALFPPYAILSLECLGNPMSEVISILSAIDQGDPRAAAAAGLQETAQTRAP